MLTKIEVARLKSKFNDVPLINPKLKSEIQYLHLKEFTRTAEGRIRKSKNKLVLMAGEVR